MTTNGEARAYNGVERAVEMLDAAYVNDLHVDLRLDMADHLVSAVKGYADAVRAAAAHFEGDMEQDEALREARAAFAVAAEQVKVIREAAFATGLIALFAFSGREPIALWVSLMALVGALGLIMVGIIAWRDNRRG